LFGIEAFSALMGELGRYMREVGYVFFGE